MFWMWCHQGIALLLHDGGAWPNALFPTAAGNVNCWADVANLEPLIWLAGDTENFERQLTG